MSELRFTKDHEWVRLEGEVATVGITTHAAEALGDVVFVDLPSLGKTVAQFKEVAAVESVKAASEIYAPVGGEVIEVNAGLADNPAAVNEDPEGGAWFLKLKVKDASELGALMTKAAYSDYLKTLS
jgi:glycine cleavage system H protein